jgi:hypothetical protein
VVIVSSVCCVCRTISSISDIILFPADAATVLFFIDLAALFIHPGRFFVPRVGFPGVAALLFVLLPGTAAVFLPHPRLVQVPYWVPVAPFCHVAAEVGYCIC